jgi:hypothetical protein
MNALLTHPEDVVCHSFAFRANHVGARRRSQRISLTVDSRDGVAREPPLVAIHEHHQVLIVGPEELAALLNPSVIHNQDGWSRWP